MIQVWPFPPDQVGNLTVIMCICACIYVMHFVHIELSEDQHIYGELIDLFEEAECECPNIEDLLCSKFKKTIPQDLYRTP